MDSEAQGTFPWPMLFFQSGTAFHPVFFSIKLLLLGSADMLPPRDLHHSRSLQGLSLGPVLGHGVASVFHQWAPEAGPLSNPLLINSPQLGTGTHQRTSPLSTQEPGDLVPNQAPRNGVGHKPISAERQVTSTVGPMTGLQMFLDTTR